MTLLPAFSRFLSVLLLACSLLQTACAAEEPVVIAPPAVDEAKAAGELRTVVLAGGCFWGVHGVYQHMKGVRKVVSGYAGGSRDTAHYELVSNGTTGHAEAVEITYDPAEISYGTLLQVFFSVAHDPTQLNRQGPDRGTQYRSAIFYANDSEKNIAETYIKQLDTAGSFPAAIVTRVDPLRRFYPAEAYHQDYLLQHPNQPYIVINDLPKIGALKGVFPELYTPEPVRVAGTLR